MARDARRVHPKVVAGDFNAWAEEWGSKKTKARGKSLLEAFAGLDLILANRGNKCTFERNGRTSIIDLTLTSAVLTKNLTWNVDESYTHSDHQAIKFEISEKKDEGNNQTKKSSTHSGWVTRAMDEEVLSLIVRDTTVPEETAEDKATALIKALSAACDAAMPRRKINMKRKPMYWWSEDINKLRKECFKARRKSQRSVGSNRQENERQRYATARKRLRDDIRKKKRECFKELCEDADRNPWGGAYRVVMSKLKGPKTPTEKCPEMLRQIVGVLFPEQDPNWTIQEERVLETDIPEITTEEIIAAGRRIGANKAPGPDKIPNKALKIAMTTNPSLFADVMMACLQQKTFPTDWKRQNLVLLPKPGKPPGDPAAYRPICLLDTVGKVLERVIQNRLLEFTESESGLSDHQFGFRKERSTIDAMNKVVSIARKATEGKRWKGGTMKYCAIITLDMKNAFNTANWGNVMRALQRIGVPSYLLQTVGNYLKDRVLLYETEDGTKAYQVTGGVPQGSVLGPILWIIMYDGVLRLTLPAGVEIICFADDIVLVVTAKHLDELELLANESIALVKNWIEETGLSVAEHKTEVMLVSRRKKKEQITVKIGHLVVVSKDELKYLGVILDGKLGFKTHIEYACAKASTTYSALARMMCNIGGPRSSRRLLLARVVTSTLLYGAQIWADALNNKENRRQMQSVHRLTALRVASAYRTVSDEAAGVVAGLMPIDIMADEAKRRYDRKGQGHDGKETRREEQARSTEMWQNRWNESQKGRWTFRLIPNVKDWADRKHGELNYHFTQFLTGHGGYRKYLHRFGHDESPLCPTCGEDEDVEHVVFECPRFQEERRRMQDVTQENMNPDNIIATMTSSQEAWNAVCAAIETINEKLRHIEKERRN